MTFRAAPSHEPPAGFDAPWHGQVFALAVAMNEAGHFTWSEWTHLFGETLNTTRGHHALDGSEDYYIAWITTLERLMIEKQIIPPQMLNEMKTRWTEAFLRTPHGKPVTPDMSDGLET